MSTTNSETAVEKSLRLLYHPTPGDESKKKTLCADPWDKEVFFCIQRLKEEKNMTEKEVRNYFYTAQETGRKIIKKLMHKYKEGGQNEKEA